jgi:hypothetical protein
MWKGYFGLMFGTKSDGVNYDGLRQGFDFNLPLNPNNGSITGWWATSNSKSETQFNVDYYNTPMGTTGGPGNGPMPFTYIRSLSSGDTLDGDLCEWNESEQIERVISNLYHKFTFNPFLFRKPLVSGVESSTNRMGYYYQPHHPIQIREYSDYIETGDKKFVADVPDYSFFSQSTNTFIWRDIYPYGFINNGVGVNYPFMNGTHYPYSDIIFRIIPEGTNYDELSLIADPIEDPCE